MSVPSSPPPPPEGPGGPYEAPTRVAGAVPAATAPAPVVDPAGPVARDADVAAAFQRLNEALRSIRTTLTIIGVIAVVALGLAIWALLRKHDVNNNNGNQRGLATQADIAATNGRIDRLSGELAGLRGVAGSGARGAASVSARLGALEQQVKALNARPNPANQTSTLQSLSSRIDKVAADVAQLKANPQTQTQTVTSTTTS